MTGSLLPLCAKSQFFMNLTTPILSNSKMSSWQTPTSGSFKSSAMLTSRSCLKKFRNPYQPILSSHSSSRSWKAFATATKLGLFIETSSQPIFYCVVTATQSSRLLTSVSLVLSASLLSRIPRMWSLCTTVPQNCYSRWTSMRHQLTSGHAAAFLLNLQWENHFSKVKMKCSRQMKSLGLWVCQTKGCGMASVKTKYSNL